MAHMVPLRAFLGNQKWQEKLKVPYHCSRVVGPTRKVVICEKQKFSSFLKTKYFLKTTVVGTFVLLAHSIQFLLFL